MSAGSDLQGFDRLYERIGLYRSHLEWIRTQESLQGLPQPVLELLAARREGLGKGKLLEWLEPREGQTFLDNGCGVGYFIFDVLDRHPSLGLRFAGAELSRTALRLLNERKNVESRAGILGAAADARKLPFRDASFDAVICSEVLDHTPAPGPGDPPDGAGPSAQRKAPHDRPQREGGALLGSAPEPGTPRPRPGEAEEEYFETYVSIPEIRGWIRGAGLTIRKEDLNTSLPLGTVFAHAPAGGGEEPRHARAPDALRAARHELCRRGR